MLVPSRPRVQGQFRLDSGSRTGPELTRIADERMRLSLDPPRKYSRVVERSSELV